MVFACGVGAARLSGPAYSSRPGAHPLVAPLDGTGDVGGVKSGVGEVEEVDSKTDTDRS